jgi:hypothetical protein
MCAIAGSVRLEESEWIPSGEKSISPLTPPAEQRLTPSRGAELAP